MRCDFFEFSQTFSIILLVNHEPVIAGTDDGIWRRIRLIPWNETVPASKKRPQEDVVDDLKAEGPAIMNWLLAGLRDWQENRGWTAERVTAATQKYREAQDILGPFLAAKCEEGPHYKVPVSDLYAVYETWCVEAHEDPITKKELGSKLRDRSFSTKPEGDGNVLTWQGIRLKVRVHTRDDSISPPGKATLADDMEASLVSTRKPSETPGLDFNHPASSAPLALTSGDLSILSLSDLEARAVVLVAEIQGPPPRQDLMPEYERVAGAIAQRQAEAAP